LEVRTGLDQKDNEAHKIIEKATEMNYVYKVVELEFESSMEFKKKTQGLSRIDENNTKYYKKLANINHSKVDKNKIKKA
ncbi:4462_t:CDS:2, partial [Gigaspora margarita]